MLRKIDWFMLISAFFFMIAGTGILGFVEYQKRQLKTSKKTRPRKEKPKKPKGPKIPFQKGASPKEFVDKNGSTMVLIPAGKWIGPDGKEQEMHLFLIDTTEVTYKQFQAFLRANPEWQKGGKKAREFADPNYLKDWDGLEYPKEKENSPVVWVSWYAAKAYAEWLGKRLPTEKEWMRAASGKTWQTYPWGEEAPSKQRANFGNLYGKTLEVNTLMGGLSPEGCFHMAGNVWEWCEDSYSLPFLGLTWRLIKGGSYRNLPENLAIPYRSGEDPKTCREDVGFRCAWSPKEKKKP